MLKFTAAILSFTLLITPAHSQLLEVEKKTIALYKQVLPTVVNVSNIKVARSFFNETVEVPQGAGSGFVWDTTGHIVTNFHVVNGGDDFVVTFHNDPTQYQAVLVGSEPKKDLAVLKLKEKPKTLTPISVGTSKELQVGQMTLAIGSPFGLDHTLTTGIVSAVGRKIDGFGGVKIHDMIQTDAAINMGNSGGPLLDSSGKLIDLLYLRIERRIGLRGSGRHCEDDRPTAYPTRKSHPPRNWYRRAARGREEAHRNPRGCRDHLC